MPGPSVLPSLDPGVSGDFWGSQECCQGPFRPSGSMNSLGKNTGVGSRALLQGILPTQGLNLGTYSREKSNYKSEIESKQNSEIL